MTAKELIFEEEARNKLKEGIDQLAEVQSIQEQQEPVAQISHGMATESQRQH